MAFATLPIMPLPGLVGATMAAADLRAQADQTFNAFIFSPAVRARYRTIPC
ncbi:hypothetical protein V474_15650 [Novosphingobium barchaimii LL02]|uniref:Uncharacterized protein n=1 Tax=Novosphingobium barchaimii LL02 TaxID=1114963 RepID=A0A0J8AQH2_9SPHN|nr:hypothetical protein V474_15650 [Novosphingobium barchaimii LL02]